MKSPFAWILRILPGVAPIILLWAAMLQPGLSAANTTSCSMTSVPALEFDAVSQSVFQGLQASGTPELGAFAVALAGEFDCVIDQPPVVMLFKSGFEPANEALKLDCGSQYCDDVGYCGAGNSANSGFAFHPGPELNRLCFEHDRCYGLICENRVPQCAFAQANASIADCDRSILNYCGNLPSGPIFGGDGRLVERMICKGASLLAALPRPGLCGPACGGGQVCVSGSGSCGMPPTPTLPNGTIFWVFGAIRTGRTSAINCSVYGFHECVLPNCEIATNLCIQMSGLTFDINSYPHLINCSGSPSSPCN